MKKPTPLHVRGLTTEEKRKFNAEAALRGHSVSSAVRWLARQVIDKTIKLTEKDDK